MVGEGGAGALPGDADAGDPFAGPGEVRALARELDWESTPLGAVEGWPRALRAVVRTCLESPIPINLWCGPELTLIYNDAYREVLGRKHPGALGRPGSEVWSEIWPEIEPLFEQVAAGGPPVYAADTPFEVQREQDGGKARTAWFTFSVSAVRSDGGELLGYLNIALETTGRVRAEEAREQARRRAEHAEARLLDVFAQAPAFMAVLRGEDHTFEYANRAYYQLVGRRELVGRPVMDALPEVRGQGFEELLDGVLRTGEPFVGREMPILLTRAEDGEPEQRFVDFVYYPLTEADGTRSGVVAHGSDVTDHVRARQEAQRARAEAEEASRAKSQFLANMSHEIRTPINAIIGYSDLLELEIAGPLTEGQKGQLGRIRSSSRHLLTLVEDVLDLAKVEAGRMRVGRERGEAAGAAAAALELVAPQAAQRGVVLENGCGGESLAYVGDADRVRQILVNLLSNAIKFTEAGGRVRVECGSSENPRLKQATSATGPYTYLRVRDTGIGIAPEELSRIFQPFTQLEEGHTRREGGTGLGLTISRHLARLMGGDLTAESEPGVGSAFTLWLPSVAAASSSMEEKLIAEAQVERIADLGEVGQAVLERVPALLERFAARLRQDPEIPGAAGVTDIDLLDHTSAFVADIAQALIVLHRAPPDAARLLQDGTQIQRLMMELHGRQRAELGWDGRALEREWEILRDEVATIVREELPAAVHGAGTMHLVEHFLTRGERLSRASLENAIEGGA